MTWLWVEMDPRDAAIDLEVKKGDLLFCGHTHHAEICILPFLPKLGCAKKQ